MTFDVAIVGGAGHVGLPLAITFATKGLKVLIQDINQAALETIAAGKLPALEKGADVLLPQVLEDGTLSVTADPALVGNADTVVITIGTPVDEFLDPVHKAVKQCIDDLAPNLKDGQFIVMRSTVFPGTTDWLETYFRQIGKNLLLAFCPERVVQGLSIDELQNMPQIVSGTKPKAVERAHALFGKLTDETIELTPLEAELAKLFNNSYRYISFAITNQFYMMANSVGADYHRIMDAMTRNYPRAKDMAKPGFSAGPCLFKDTMQLAAFAPDQFNLGRAAMLVNEGIVLYIIERLKQRYELADKTVGLLGMAFKPNSDDIRASLSYKLKKHLVITCRKVLTTDPLVSVDDDLLPLDTVLEKSDVLILCVPHTAYRELDTAGKPVIDIWDYLEDGTSVF
jgi:UDP-N-acetyl-D-mannosaminuronic acid dehydrogenase